MTVSSDKPVKEWTSEIVPFSISVCGLDELPDFAGHPITHVLSILDPEMPAPEVFSTYPAHARLDLRFHDRILAGGDTVLADRADVDLVLAFGRDLLARPGPAHLLVHCHMGISRSTASMLLLLAQARPDLPGSRVMAEVVRIRTRAWPNSHIVKLGDDLLRRGGELVAAAKAQHQARLAKFPELATFFRSVGRGDEVDG